VSWSQYKVHAAKVVNDKRASLSQSYAQCHYAECRGASIKYMLQRLLCFILLCLMSNAQCHYAECRGASIKYMLQRRSVTNELAYHSLMLNVIMLSVMEPV
jgi:hypothetical protein